MWFLVIPTNLIMISCLAIPSLFTYYTNKYFLGQPYRRDLCINKYCFNYLRDERVSKSKFAYEFVGLESIPDVIPEMQQEDEMVCYRKKKDEK